MLRQNENFTANCSCRGFNIVRGFPKLGLGPTGMNAHFDDMFGGKHEAPIASETGVAAKLPTPGITRPFVDTGQAAEAAFCWRAMLVASL